MDDDDRLLSENFSESNSIYDNEIDSDLEDELYAAVFHSDDVSLNNKEIASGKLTEDLGCSVNTATRDVDAETEREINFHEETEVGPSLGMIRGQDIIDEQQEEVFCHEKQSPETNIMLRKKHSRKSPKSNDSKPSRSPVNSFWSDTIDRDAYPRGETDLCGTSIILSAPQETTESSEIKAEEETEINEPTENEKIVSLFDNQDGAIEENLGEPSSVKSEEDFGKTMPVEESEVIDKESDEATKLKPEDERAGTVESLQNQSIISSNVVPSFDSSSDDSSSNSLGPNTQNFRGNKEKVHSTNLNNDHNETIIIDDSEGSICEVPVPPKPRPVFIDLEDSESSLLANLEIMTPEKLVQDYKNAVLKSKTQAKMAGGKEGKRSKKKSDQRPGCSMSESDDSMTQSEEENWGIIAGSQINRVKPTTSSSTNIISEIEQQDSGNLIMGHENQTIDCMPEERENSITEVQTKASTSATRTITNRSKNLALDNSLVFEKRSSEGERLSQGQQRLAENNEKQKDLGNDQNTVDDDTLIINADSSKDLCDFEDIIEFETLPRTPENRKRSINDSGKKSKHQNSSKRAKSTGESAVASSTLSNNKSRKGNKDSEYKDRNCAADYFFMPMNNEMEDYYNKSWGGENFDIDAIRKQMPKDPRHWAVLNEDLSMPYQRKSRYFVESRCKNCNQTGHRMAECTQNRKIRSCHMCGTPGHQEPRCPHKMCLGCGKKQNTFMQICNGCRRAWCKGCLSYGHYEEKCPDLWRRYHVTTSHGDINTQLNVEDVMKPQHLLSCCNCAKRGHDSTTCNNYRWSRHFPTPSYVTNYTTGPAYIEGPPQEDASSPVVEQPETEKRNTESSSAHASTSKNERKKIKSNVEKVITENLEVIEILENENEKVNKNVEKVEEQLKERSKSDRKKTQKTSDEVVKKNSKSTNSKEILFTLESQLLNNDPAGAENLREFKYILHAQQYKELVDSDLGRKFLLNLTSLIPMIMKIKRSRIGEISMFITSTPGLYVPILTTIVDWLNRPIDERSRFIELNLPNTKEDLVKLLSDKISELKKNLGDPLELYEDIQLTKHELVKLQNQSQAGTKMSTCSKRARIVEKLANSQCRLNMILFGQLKTKMGKKSVKFVKSVLTTMQNAENESSICTATYLLLVHHYNIIFSAYTPKNLLALLDDYISKFPKKKKTKLMTKYKKLITESRKQQNIKPLSSLDLNPSFNTCDQILPLNIDGNMNSSGSGNISNEDCTIVENQSVVSKTDLNNANDHFHPNVPPARISSIINLNTDYSSSQGNRGEVQYNREQEDYIALDNRSSPSKHAYKIMGGSYKEKSGRKNGMFQPLKVKNGCRYNLRSQKTAKNNSPFERYRRLEGCSPTYNESPRDMFYSDTRGAESSQNYLNNEIIYDSPRNEIDDITRKKIETKNSYNSNDPSTSGIQNNELRIHSDNNQQSPGSDQNRNGSNKKQKKKVKGTKLPPYLQQRAAENITKYIEMGYADITQAARAMQKKISDKVLTFQNVRKFETLIKRRFKKTDHLL